MAGKKLRIGILTFWWSADNYGQLLQCYALQKYLRDAGHDAFLIRYNPENDFARTPLWKRILKAFNPVLLFNYLNLKNRKRLGRAEQKQHSRRFDEFRTKYIVQSEKIYRSYSELKESPPEADCYIVGSDQVWNVFGNSNPHYLNSFFLNFGDKRIKRIAYAVSWGSCPEDFESKTIADLLRNFELITCREKSGVSICKNNGVSAKLVCDPTLLLAASEWKKLCTPTKINKKYVFAYMLKNTCKFSYKKMKNWADLHNLDVVYVSGNYGYCSVNFHDKHSVLSYPNICEWLGLIASAEYVVTNSFHCSVFSLLFRKKIATIPLSGILKNSNARISTLFSSLKADNVEIMDNNFDVLFSCMNQSIEESFIDESKRILIDSLDFGGAQ